MSDKYDEGANKILLSTQSDAVFLVVIGDKKQTGMSFVATDASYDIVRRALPKMLVQIALEIRRQNRISDRKSLQS